MILKSIKYKSFYIGDELIGKIIVVFFYIDNHWYHCSVGDGLGEFSIEENEPDLINLSEIEGEFKYPIYEMKDSFLISNFLDVEISMIEKIVSREGEEEGLIGYRIKMVNEHFLIVWDNRDSTEFVCDEIPIQLSEFETKKIVLPNFPKLG